MDRSEISRNFKLPSPMSEFVSQGSLNLKITQMTALAEEISGMMMVYDLQDETIVYMSPRGLKFFGISLEQVKGMYLKDYFTRFLNSEDTGEYYPKLQELVHRNNGETLTLLQQMPHAETGEWIWHMSSIKIMVRDADLKPLLGLTISFRIDTAPQVTAKANRVLEETAFLRKHRDDFAKLGKREGEILKLLALGKSSAEIAEELCISAATADTHRRNIKQKLNTSSFYELCQYARAFDLI